ncbi:hypothetical protein MFLAVUS_010956 [Mucor flavus]|uniref:Uncharacterized protein n=1 Tax=Mucor flavus TaxID=439312 RepID=A0ABP9ZE57_9FUNG
MRTALVPNTKLEALLPRSVHEASNEFEASSSKLNKQEVKMNKKRGLRKALSSELITDYEKREGHAQNSFNSIYKRDSPDGGDGGSDGGSIGLCLSYITYILFFCVKAIVRKMRTVALVAFTVAVFVLFTGGDAYTINRKRRLSLDEGELWNIGLFEEYIGSTHGKKEKSLGDGSVD